MLLHLFWKHDSPCQVISDIESNGDLSINYGTVGLVVGHLPRHWWSAGPTAEIWQEDVEIGIKPQTNKQTDKKNTEIWKT